MQNKPNVRPTLLWSKFFKIKKKIQIPICIWKTLTQTTYTEINEGSENDCIWYTVHISALNDVSKIAFYQKILIFLHTHAHKWDFSSLYKDTYGQVTDNS